MCDTEVQSFFSGGQRNLVVRDYHGHALRSCRLRTLTQLDKAVDHV
jgi:hypothetical protein